MAEDGGVVTFTGKSFTARFDKANAAITSYQYKGIDLLERGPMPDFWRAPINNDRGAWKNIFREPAKAQTRP
jgi:beta-galactosidase